MKVQIDTESLEEALEECLRRNPDKQPTLTIGGKELTYSEILDKLRQGSTCCPSMLQEIVKASLKLWVK